LYHETSFGLFRTSISPVVLRPTALNGTFIFKRGIDSVAGTSAFLGIDETFLSSMGGIIVDTSTSAGGVMV
jgi:hypothetical protein